MSSADQQRIQLVHFHPLVDLDQQLLEKDNTRDNLLIPKESQSALWDFIHMHGETSMGKANSISYINCTF
jgi:hypothetical protein